MRGQLLSFDTQTGQGVISGDDGNRYPFSAGDWQDSIYPAKGQTVDFEAPAGSAVAIYRVAGGNPLESGEKSKIVAALLALFLGPLGVHKFYLGMNTAGFILLGTTILGWLTLIILIGFPLIMATGIISFIEFIIYIASSDADFDAKYVQGKKQWF